MSRDASRIQLIRGGTCVADALGMTPRSYLCSGVALAALACSSAQPFVPGDGGPPDSGAGYDAVVAFDSGGTDALAGAG